MGDNHDYERERRMLGRMDALESASHVLRRLIHTRASEEMLAIHALGMIRDLAALQFPFPGDDDMRLTEGLDEIRAIARRALEP